MSTKTTVLGLAELGRQESGEFPWNIGGKVVIGVQRGKVIYTYMFPVDEVNAMKEPGGLLTFSICRLLDQHAGQVGGMVKKSDRIGLAYIEETMLDGFLSAELELDVVRVCIEPLPNLALEGALIACRGSVRADQRAKERKRGLRRVFGQIPFMAMPRRGMMEYGAF